jgi:hypothetical protein
MTRVGSRIQELLKTLEAIDDRFSEQAPPLSFPSSDITERVATLEAKVGPLPLSVAGFYRYVGAVVLIGGHPGAGARVIYLKEPCADAAYHGDSSGITFLSYLRNSLSHAGFPGFGQRLPEVLKDLCGPVDF